MKLNTNERRKQMLQMVISERDVTIKKLATIFNVTTETVRKDVTYLEDKALIVKNHGSVTAVEAFIENEFTSKQADNRDAKSLIAKFALSIIEKNSSVFLDASTTVLYLAQLLVLRNDLTVITNSLQIADVLSNSENKLLVTGGQYRSKSNSFVGEWTKNQIAHINFDYAFMACDGFTEQGPTIHAYEELDIKKAIIDQSSKVVLLSDTSKLNNRGLYTFCDYDQIHLLISERNLNEQEMRQFPDHLMIMSE